MKVTFEGGSDDTFGAYWGGGGVDHDDCASLSLRVLRVKAGGHQMLVSGIYGQGDAGTWLVGIAPVEEDEPIPPWPMEWSFSGYTAQLVVDLPDGFEITLVQPEENDD